MLNYATRKISFNPNESSNTPSNPQVNHNTEHFKKKGGRVVRPTINWVLTISSTQRSGAGYCPGFTARPLNFFMYSERGNGSYGVLSSTSYSKTD